MNGLNPPALFQIGRPSGDGLGGSEPSSAWEEPPTSLDQETTVDDSSDALDLDGDAAGSEVIGAPRAIEDHSSDVGGTYAVVWVTTGFGKMRDNIDVVART